jgi:hypothetical protein
LVITSRVLRAAAAPVADRRTMETSQILKDIEDLAERATALRGYL